MSLLGPEPLVKRKQSTIYLDAFLQVSFTRSHHAKSALLLQPAVGVVIGDSGGDAHSAGL